MQKLRNLGRVLAALWLLGIVILGVGGSWLTRGGEEQVFSAMTGMDPEDMQKRAQESSRKREERREARDLSEDGWGTQTDMDGGWGTGS